MRNEGPFIVEWICWYRMLGFTDIVVVTNNCTDHSPDLLDALQDAGWVHHIRHDIHAGKHITRAKLRAARAHKSVRRATWLMICDVDEFLVIHRGDGKIGDLIDRASMDHSYIGMSVNWKVFGTSGKTEYEDELVHRQFIYANSSNHNSSKFVKSIYRMSRCFKDLGEHVPRHPNLEKILQSKDKPEYLWINSDGKKIPHLTAGTAFRATIPRYLVSHKVAQINHYMLRSAETYSLKKGTKSPVALSNRYTEKYFLNADAGNEIDSSTFYYSANFCPIHDQAMALPNVAYLHALCCADHLKSILDLANENVEANSRYNAFVKRIDDLAKEIP